MFCSRKKIAFSSVFLVSLIQSGVALSGVTFGGRNDAWMSEMSDIIGDKKLSQIVLPGTHDSGTSGIGGANGNVAKTQVKTIGEQLSDGIRYFDIRLTENAHRDCADPSVWWIHHGERDSYRFQDAVTQIKDFVKDPSHKNELIVLDLQETVLKYNDGRALNVLFDYIEKQLGGPDGYILNKASKNYGLNRPIKDIWAYNKKSDKKRQIIVLVPEGDLNISESGCGARFSKDNFYSRDQYLYGFYREVEDANGKKPDIDSALSQSIATNYNNVDIFNRYRSMQQSGGLTVLNLAPRPSNSWYATAWANFSGLALYDYANYYVNYPLNVLEKPNCYEGWLGKRLYISYNSVNMPASLRDTYNTPNIVMIDAYDKWLNWASVYLNGSTWRYQRSGSFVDFIKAVNQNAYPTNSSSFTYNDGQCL